MEKKKIVVIGDVHGEPIWKDVVLQHPDAIFVFLGDYCDPYNCDLFEDDVLNNLSQIIKFKQEHSDNVILLLGNHDMQYIDDTAELCSRYMVRINNEIEELFKENKDSFQKIHAEGNLLFTHAGISQNWLQTNFANMDKGDILEIINNHDNAGVLHHCGKARGGRMPYGGIFWADKNEMCNPLNGFIQIVGHTRVPDISLKCIDENTAIFFCDCLAMGKYLSIEQKNGSLYFYEMQLEDDKMTLLHTLQL